MDKAIEKIASMVWAYGLNLQMKEQGSPMRFSPEDFWEQRLINKNPIFDFAQHIIKELGYRKPLDSAELEKEINELIKKAILDYNQDPNPECAFGCYVPSVTKQIIALILPKDKPPSNEDRIYSCDKCEKMRSKDEGGTTFTLCDECWSKLYPSPKG